MDKDFYALHYKAGLPLTNNINPCAIRDFVICKITEWIIQGQIKPGDKLIASQIAQKLDLSSIPIREALFTLEGTGIVKRIDRRGFYLAKISISDLNELYCLRKLLEDEVHRICVPKITNNNISQLRLLNDEMQESAQKGENILWIMQNREFHFVPFKHMNNIRMMRFINQLWDSNTIYIAAHVFMGTAYQKIHDQHNTLIDAFYKRDSNLVNKLMTDHRDFTFDTIKNKIIDI